MNRSGKRGRDNITKGVGHGNGISARIVTTIFQKETNHLISYSSGENKTQIDYIMAGKEHAEETQNYEVLFHQKHAVTSQHQRTGGRNTCKEKRKSIGRQLQSASAIRDYR